MNTLVGPDQLPGLEVTQVGAHATDLSLVDADQVTDTLARLVRVDTVTRWLHGDLTMALVASVGDAETWRRIAALHPDQALLERCVAVAVAVPHRVRRPNLSWTHHHLVHRLPVADQDRWLQAAEAGGWSARTLAAKIREHTETDRPPLPGLGRLPTPPATPLRKALEQVGEHGAVMWIPNDGTLSPATIRHVETRGRTAMVLVEVEAHMATTLQVVDR